MTNERRKYFRIKDTALVMYRVIQDSMLEAERRNVYLNQVKRENARAALFGLETRFQDLVDTLRGRDPHLSEALEVLNRKINLLERVAATEQAAAGIDDQFEHEPKEIDLSGGGMAIKADCPLAVGSHLAIDLVLLPDNEPMRIFGSVVETRQSEDKTFTISIAFEEIRQEDQDRLIQHVLRRQSHGLRARRESAAG